MCIIHTGINEVLGVTLYSAFNLIKTFRIMIRKNKVRRSVKSGGVMKACLHRVYGAILIRSKKKAS